MPCSAAIAGDLPAARVCIATNNITGMTRNGVGTAHASLAIYLAAVGHDVTIAFTGDRKDASVAAAFRAHFEALKVKVEFVGEAQYTGRGRVPDVERSMELYHWLRARDGAYDVVHFTECQAHGYYSLLAKQAGLAFEKTTFVVTPHGSLRWCFQGARQPVFWNSELILDVAESECLRLADVVIGPSRYMLGWVLEQGWKLPTRVFVQQYLLPVQPLSLAGLAESARLPHPKESIATRELVFFGRLEIRKGLLDFLDAVDALQGRLPETIQISFLGEPGLPIDGLEAVEFVRRRTAHWRQRVQILDDFGHAKAIAYIREAGRLPVMASTMDNLPNTILECLELGLPFLASRAGGIPEMIHPEDLASCTFEAQNPEMLAQRLIEACVERAEPLFPRFAITPEENAQTIDHWHRRIAQAPVGFPQRFFAAPNETTAQSTSLSVIYVGIDETRNDVILALQKLAALPGLRQILAVVTPEQACESPKIALVQYVVCDELPLAGTVLKALRLCQSSHVLLLESAVQLLPEAPATVLSCLSRLRPQLLTFPVHSETFLEMRHSKPRLPRGVLPVHVSPELAAADNFFGRCPVLEKSCFEEILKVLGRCNDFRNLLRGIFRRAADCAIEHLVLPDALAELLPTKLSKEPRYGWLADVGPFEGMENFGAHSYRVQLFRALWAVFLRSEERIQKLHERRTADTIRAAERLEKMASELEKSLQPLGKLRSILGFVIGLKRPIRASARTLRHQIDKLKSDAAKERTRAQQLEEKAKSEDPNAF